MKTFFSFGDMFYFAKFNKKPNLLVDYFEKKKKLPVD